MALKLDSSDVVILSAAAIVAIGVTVVFAARLVQQPHRIGWKFKRWIKGIGDAISLLLGM